MRRSGGWAIVLFAACVATVGARDRARADTFTWVGASGTQSWESASNWDPSSGYPDAAGAVARFVSTGPWDPWAPGYVPTTLETSQATLTVGSIDFGSAAYVNGFSGAGGAAAGTLIFDNGGSAASITRGSVGTTNGLTLKFTTYQLNSDLDIDENGTHITSTLGMQGRFTGSGGLNLSNVWGDAGWAGFTLGASAHDYAGGTTLTDATLTLQGSIVGGVAMSGNSLFKIDRVGAQSSFMSGAISGVGAVSTAGNTFDIDTNSWRGALQTLGNFPGPIRFTSIKNVGGGPSALGAPETAAEGRIYVYGGGGTLEYIGAGDTTDREIDYFGFGDWSFTVNASGSTTTASPFRITSDLGGGGMRDFHLGGSGAGEWAGGLGTTIGAGGGQLIKRDAGTWTLSGNNTYTVGTTLNEGRLRVGSDTALGTGAITLNTGSLSAASTTARTLANAISVAGSVTLGDAVDTGPLTFTGSVSLGGAVREVATLSDVTLAGVVSDGGVTKTGAGRLMLSGANTYTGATTVEAGTLQIGAGGATGSLAPSSAITGAAGATLAFGRTNTVVQGTDFNAVIDGPLNVAQVGSGTLVLGGENTYTGTTAVNAGTLQIGAGGAAGSVSNASVLALGGGTLRMNRIDAATQVFASTVLNPGDSALAANADNTVDLGPVIRTVGATLDVSPVGSFLTSTPNTDGTLGAGITYGGTTWAVAAGTSPIYGLSSSAYTTTTAAGDTAANYAGNPIDVTSSQAPAGPITPGSLRFNDAAPWTLTLDAGGPSTVTGGILVTPAVGGNASRISGGTLAGSSGGDLVVLQRNAAGVLTIGAGIVDNGGATGLTKSGAGTLTLAGANTYTGVTQIGAGTLQLGDDGTTGSLSPSSGITGAAGVTLAFARTNTVTQGVDFAAAIGGAINVVQRGAGTLVLTGTNTYTGTTSIEAGTLQVGGGGTTGSLSPSSTITGVAGATLAFDRTNTVTQGDDFAAAIGGTINVAQRGPGTLVFTAANTYSGTTSVEDGTLVLAAAGSLLPTGAVETTAAGAAFDISGITAPGLTIGSLAGVAGSTVALGGRTLTFGDGRSTAFAGVIDGAAGGLVKQGAGTAVLAGGNTYTGSTTITAGTLQVGAGGTTGSLAAASAIGGSVGAMLAFDRSDTVTQGVDFAGAIGGAINVAQRGPGTLVLNGANTYTGTTSIEAGALVLAAGGSLASPVISVGSGATFDVSAVSGYALATGVMLRGVGTVTGAVTGGDGSTLAPGDGAGGGTLTLNGGLTLDAGAQVLLARPGSSLLDVTGDYTDALGAHVMLTAGTMAPGQVSVFLQWTGASPAGMVSGTQGNWNVASRGLKEWVGTASAGWDDAPSWDGVAGVILADVAAKTLSLQANSSGAVPIVSNDVVIDPTAPNIVVAGPAANATVANLQLGGGNGTAPTLTLGGGNLTVTGTTIVLSDATVNATGGGLITPTLDVAGASATVTLASASGNVTTANVSAGTLTVDDGVVGTVNLSGAGSLAGSLTLPQVNVTGGAPSFSGNAATVAVSGGGVTTTGGTIGTFSHGAGAGTSTIGAATAVTLATVSAGTVNYESAVGGGSLTVPKASTGTVVVGAGAAVATADFSAGAGTVNAAAPLAVASQVKLPGGVTATLTDAASFTVTGANLAGESAARRLTLSGGTLTVAAGSPGLPVIGSGPSVWFDAANPDTLFADTAGTTPVTNDGQSVARWNSVVGGYAMVQGTAELQPTIAMNRAAGNPVVDFGVFKDQSGWGQFMDLAASDGSPLRLNVGETPHTVFWIVQGSNFLLGESDYYNFHRGDALTPTAPIWSAAWASDVIKNGETYLNKTQVNGTEVGLTGVGTFDLVDLITTGGGDAWFNALARDRIYRFGGMQHGEIIVFPGALGTTDRQAVENYLSAKWITGGGSSGTTGLTATTFAATGGVTSTLDLGETDVPKNTFAIGGLSLTAGTSGSAGTTHLLLQGGSNVNVGGISVAYPAGATGGRAAAIGSGSTSPVLSLASGATVGVDGNVTLTIGSVIGDTPEGTTALTKVGAGTLVLAASNSYSGATIVGGGTLQVGDGGTTGSLGTGIALSGSAGGTIAFNRSDTQVQGVDFPSVINGGVGVTQLGSGTLTLSGGILVGNSYGGGTRIANGTILLGNSKGLPNYSAVTFGTGSTSGVLDLAGSDATLGSLTFEGTGSQVVPGGALKLQKITGNATITVNSGSHAVDPDTTLVSNAVITTAPGSALVLRGPIDGGGDLTKLGGGRLSLAGIASYTGATTVGGGILSVNGELQGSPAVTVEAGAALGGSGVITGDVGGDGVIAPGSSPGILTVLGQVVPTGTTSFAFEFSATGDPAWSNATASVNDLLRLTNASPFASPLASGNVVDIYFDVASLAAGDAFTGGFFSDQPVTTLDFAVAVGSPTYRYFVRGDGGGPVSYNDVAYYSLEDYIDLFAPAFTGVAASVVTVPSADFSTGTVTDGQATRFEVFAVPEPSTTALAVVAGVAACLLRRRTRRALGPGRRGPRPALTPA